MNPLKFINEHANAKVHTDHVAKVSLTSRVSGLLTSEYHARKQDTVEPCIQEVGGCAVLT